MNRRQFVTGILSCAFASMMGQRGRRMTRAREISEWRGVVLHHSATAPHLPVSAIDAAHRARGWRGIGYHLVIAPDGQVIETFRFRDGLLGAHCRGHNERIGICVMGNFEYGRPTPKQLQAVRRLLGNWPLERIATHRELGRTVCPGKHLQEWVEEYRRERADGEGATEGVRRGEPMHRA